MKDSIGGLVVFIALFLIVSLFVRSAYTNTEADKLQKYVNQDKLFELVNLWKQSKGNPYIKSEKLCEYASKRVGEIKVNWNHSGFESTEKEKRLELGFSKMGENLAKNIYDEFDVLNAWLSSPLHYKNLTDNFTYSCIKCEDNYCVQLFAK